MLLFLAGASHADPPSTIHVIGAREGCLDIQKADNITHLVAQVCEGRHDCQFHAPSSDDLQREHVPVATRDFCTQGVDIRYNCGSGTGEQFAHIDGDAWKHPPAALHCAAASPPPNNGPTDTSGINVIEADIGCLAMPQGGNLTRLVAGACDGKSACVYKAPTQSEYQAAGVRARTRDFCTQGMKIVYRCGSNNPQTVDVDGDAWNHPPAVLQCGTVASDEETLANLPNEACASGWPSQYLLAPPDMLDWSHVEGDTFPIENHMPDPATREMYERSRQLGWMNALPGRHSPGDTLGAVEGRIIGSLREIASQKDPIHALCESASAFAGRPGDHRTPSPEWANAAADLAVTGREAFARFRENPPTLAMLEQRCGGLSNADYNRALDRAYALANAIRITNHDPALDGGKLSATRRALGWAAVSGEDDKPHRPVNVPSANFPQFDIVVNTSGIVNGVTAVNTRFMIAHARPPQFRFNPPRGTQPHQLNGEILPELAPDAQVILFIHGMDSRVEEALNLQQAMHRLAEKPGGKNWTLISFDLPTQGYSDNIDHERAFGPAHDVGCHHTPMVDFYENFIIRFVDSLDAAVHGALKPKIRAVVGGSLGGNMCMRLGRHNFLPGNTHEDWIRAGVCWSPAAIWPPMSNRPGVAAGCDNGWDALYDVANNWGLDMASHPEKVQERRNLFYGGFDYGPPGSAPQATYWWRDGWQCKLPEMFGARVDRHETYTGAFRQWHWRLGIEQLVFSQRQNLGPDSTKPALHDPLFLYNRTPMLLLSGEKDVGGDLGKWTHDTAPLMKNTPGLFRWLGNTGHSLDDERPNWVAEQIVEFLSAH